MKRILLTILFLLIATTLFGQTSPTQSPTSHNKQRVEQNVKDYGAKSDTTISAVTSFKRALAAVPDSGGIVNIPAGNYLLDTTWVINKANTIIKSDGGVARIFFRKDSAVACSVVVPNVTIEGIYFDKSSDTGYYQAIVYDSAADGLTIRGCTFAGGGRQVRIIDANNFTHDGNKHTSVTDARSPVSLWGVSGFSITNNLFKDIVFPALEAGGSPPRLIYIQNSNFGTVMGNILKNCDFDVVNGGAGISLGYYSHNVDIVGNVICSLKYADGLLVEEGAHDWNIASNVSSWNDWYDTSAATAQGDGADIYNTYNGSIVGNVFKNNGRGGSNGHPGVEIWGSTRITVANNVIDSNGQNGIQTVNSSALKYSNNFVQWNGRNGASLTTANVTVNTGTDSTVTRTGGTANFGLGWQRGDTVIINSVKYLIDSVIDNSSLRLQSSAGSQSGVTLQYKCFDYTLYGNTFSSNNADSNVSIQNQSGIYIDAATDAGYLIRNTTVDTRLAGHRKQNYGVYIAGGSVRYWGHLAKDNVTGQFTDAVTQSKGIVDTLSFLSVYRSGKLGYLYGDTLGDTNTTGFSIGTSSNSAGSGQPLWFNVKAGSTQRNIFAIHPMLFDATGRATGRLAFLGKANTSDTVMRQAMMIGNALRVYFGADSAHWWSVPTEKPTGSGIWLLADTATKTNSFWYPLDSIIAGAGGVTSSELHDTANVLRAEMVDTAQAYAGGIPASDVSDTVAAHQFGVDSTAASGGVKRAESGIIRSKNHYLVMGVDSTGDTVLVAIDSSYFWAGDSMLVSNNIKASGGIVRAVGFVGQSIQSSSGAFGIEAVGDSIYFTINGTCVLALWTHDTTTVMSLCDNVALNIDVDAASFDSVSAKRFCIDDTLGNHVWCFGSYTPADSDFVMHLGDTTVNVSISQMHTLFSGGGGGTISADTAGGGTNIVSLSGSYVLQSARGVHLLFDNQTVDTIGFTADSAAIIAIVTPYVTSVTGTDTSLLVHTAGDAVSSGADFNWNSGTITGADRLEADTLTAVGTSSSIHLLGPSTGSTYYLRWPQDNGNANQGLGTNDGSGQLAWYSFITGSSPTITTPTLTLAQSASPTPTAEGAPQWDTDDDWLVIGDGSGQKYVFPASKWTGDVTQNTSGVTAIGSNKVLTGMVSDGTLLPGDVDSTGQKWQLDSLYGYKLAISGFLSTTRSDSTFRIASDELILTNESTTDTMMSVKDSSSHTVVKVGDNTDFIMNAPVYKVAATADSAFVTLNKVGKMIADTLTARLTRRALFLDKVAVPPTVASADSSLYLSLGARKNQSATSRGANDTIMMLVDSTNTPSGDTVVFPFYAQIPVNIVAESLVFSFEMGGATDTITHIYIYADTTSRTAPTSDTAYWSEPHLIYADSTAKTSTAPRTYKIALFQPTTLYRGRVVRAYVRGAFAAAASAAYIHFRTFYLIYYEKTP